MRTKKIVGRAGAAAAAVLLLAVCALPAAAQDELARGYEQQKALLAEIAARAGTGAGPAERFRAAAAAADECAQTARQSLAFHADARGKLEQFRAVCVQFRETRGAEAQSYVARLGGQPAIGQPRFPALG